MNTGFNAAAMVGISETFFADSEKETMDLVVARALEMGDEAHSGAIQYLLANGHLTPHQLERARRLTETEALSLIEATTRITLLTAEDAEAYAVDSSGAWNGELVNAGLATSDQIWYALWYDQQDCILSGRWGTNSQVLTNVPPFKSHDLARALGLNPDLLRRTA